MLNVKSIAWWHSSMAWCNTIEIINSNSGLWNIVWYDYARLTYNYINGRQSIRRFPMKTLSIILNALASGCLISITIKIWRATNSLISGEMEKSQVSCSIAQYSKDVCRYISCESLVYNHSNLDMQCNATRDACI